MLCVHSRLTDVLLYPFHHNGRCIWRWWFRTKAICPLEMGNQPAEAHHEPLENVLTVNAKTTEMICCIICDNTKKAFATTMNVMLISCASHRLNLAAQNFLITDEPLADQVKNSWCRCVAQTLALSLLVIPKSDRSTGTLLASPPNPPSLCMWFISCKD